MSHSDAVTFSSDERVMERALELAGRGRGLVEPNPMVGAVIVDGQRRLIAEGWHQRFGGPHAEVNALKAAGPIPAGATLFVTLEPCSHHGKTPPCADAVIAAGFERTVIGCQDPAPHVAGRGIARLRNTGMVVDVGVCETLAQELIAPFRMVQTERRPWVHAKWAMTLDGRIATRSGHSQWISNADSRGYVHQLRGRMDAILTAAGTVRADNPQLTARPAGMRTALRVVLDRTGESLTADCHLVQTARQTPVLLAADRAALGDQMRGQLEQAGVEIFFTSGDTRTARVASLLEELGRRQCTNVLLEAGPGLLGACLDAGVIDEVHAFVAPKLVGGADAKSPIDGVGRDRIPELSSLEDVRVQPFGTDTLIHGRMQRRDEIRPD
ncbi:MAG: bifunctional diaminohydroxyphosphoribosylaminopyrimidine deaminase/5-amino-6-(5-phosphoribosylamino)uracil reductase RibD [Planctomycetaceae bacterium]|nr:bifunctional diaminohydroxyphosphoribosylaminopyrimidine deaminase/5-amino-6-(5-phosphoribosylamino)uracil reductase RibD [Planctomycetaceae bacterium]